MKGAAHGKLSRRPTITLHPAKCTIKRIQCLVQIFMPYRMMYHLTHNFAFLNFCFSPFYEQFRHLRKKYTLELQKYSVLFRISCPTRWYIICLINLNFKFLSPSFCEHFCWLREKYTLKRQIKHIILISSLSSFWWCACIVYKFYRVIPEI